LPDGDISEEVLNMYAVILTGGKQYKVSEGDVIEVEKLDAEVGASVELEVLMTVDGETVLTGKDVKAKATATVLAQGKDKKVVVYTYKPKKNERKKKGHRQPFTRIKIDKLA
jgi:large subunit ribosomal protein L21